MILSCSRIGIIYGLTGVGRNIQNIFDICDVVGIPKKSTGGEIQPNNFSVNTQLGNKT
jgi:hypothetical protein